MSAGAGPYLRWRDAPREYGPTQDPLQSLEAVEVSDQTPPVRERPRTRDVRADDGRPGLEGRCSEDGDDRRDLFEGASHGDQPAVEKGGPGDQRGRLIGRTKGGMTPSYTPLPMPKDARSAFSGKMVPQGLLNKPLRPRRGLVGARGFR